MRFLLDTNIFLWSALNEPSLPNGFKERIKDQRNDIYVSIVSLWEIGIKYSLGKLDLINTSIESLFSAIETELYIEMLPLKRSHILRSTTLPFHHRDPFDRLIFAQSVVENLNFLYTDRIFDLYDREES